MGYYDDELMHYGVPGMKWGVRRARGHAGPGIYLTKKRQAAGDKRDLKRLERGEHLSVGLTKKRQAAYDARDKRAIESRLNKQKKDAKAEKNQYQAKKRADKAIKKLQKTKIKDLEKRYGELEDSMEYGKKADSRNNRKIQAEMNSIENEIRKMKSNNK